MGLDNSTVLGAFAVSTLIAWPWAEPLFYNQQDEETIR